MLPDSVSWLPVRQQQQFRVKSVSTVTVASTRQQRRRSIRDVSQVPVLSLVKAWSLLRGDGGDAPRSLHDETHLYVREAVLFGLGAALIRGRHVQVEAQRHGLLPQLGIPSEEGALPLFYHLIDLLRPGKKDVTNQSCFYQFLSNPTGFSVLPGRKPFDQAKLMSREGVVSLVGQKSRLDHGTRGTTLSF